MSSPVDDLACPGCFADCEGIGAPLRFADRIIACASAGTAAAVHRPERSGDRARFLLVVRNADGSLLHHGFRESAPDSGV